MPPAAPSTTGLARPVAPTGQVPVSPSGAPGVPGVAQGTIAPTQGVTNATPFDTSGAMNAIANYYQIPKQTAVAAAGVEGNKFNATTAYEGQLQEQSEFAKQRLDASSYKIQNTPDGVRILDPVTGQPVDTNTFVNRTGSQGFDSLMGALQKSPNQRDQQFVSDYNNFQTYMNASLNAKNSPEAKNIMASYEAKNPQLKNLSPQQAAQMFNSEYGDYLGVGQQAQGQPQQPMYTPELSQNDLNYLLSRYIYTGNAPAVNVPGVNFNYLGSSQPSAPSSVSPPSL